MEYGERLSGRYKIIQSIGSGGMANVYLAEDLILEREVAVKVMRYDFRKDESSIRRFKREALSATELVHPNIVSIYDVGQEENPYIVMEYVKGTDLKEYIQEHYPIPYRKTLDIMRQIFSAVEYAHQSGLVHRDLKPQNILIDAEDQVKITDFGIAIALSQNSITQTNSLLGSVHYISPEQARGAMATKQSDIYSLGILLYELLTGKVPFDGESAVSIALRHFQDPLPSIRELDPHVPQPLENVVLKATAKEKHHRYQTVKEMADDLETALLPERADEPKFIPMNDDLEETMTFQPEAAPAAASDLDETKENKLETTVIRPAESEEEEEPKKKEPVKKKNRKWLLPFILLLLVFALLLVYLFSGTDDVQIPDVSGMTEAEAVQTLLEANLIVGDTIPEASDEIDEGLVTRTSPSIESLVKEDSEVDLFVSTGRETVTFEDYVGEPYEETRARLTELDFKVERVDEHSNTIPEGQIISQNIPAGEEVVPEETTVELTVSIGEAGFELIDLRNYSRRSVEDYVRDNNLNLTVEEAHSDSIPEGQVISQNPEPGTTVYSDEYVSVVISLGPQEVQYETIPVTISIPYAAPEEPAEEESAEEDTAEADTAEEEDTPETPEASETPANHIQIYVEDAFNDYGDVLRELYITEDTTIHVNLMIEAGGTGQYRVVRDGETITEEEVQANGSGS